MAKRPMEICAFECLLMQIKQETDKIENKLKLLYESKGHFNGEQVTYVLYAIPNTCDRLKALELMEDRITSLSSCDAKDILGTFSIPADKLKALKIIKRNICDTMQPRSQEIILDCFYQPDHKQKAKEILHIIKVTTKDLLPAGGHVISSPFGSLLNQSAPLDPSHYSTIYMDCYNKPPRPEEFCVPYLGISTNSKPPNYSDPCCLKGQVNLGSNKMETYGCPAFECPAKKALYRHYPSGAAPLGHHHPTERIGFEEYIVQNKMHC